MPRIPRPRTALLLAAPVMVHAGTLALWPPDEPTLAGSVPSFVATCACAGVIAWMASPSESDEGRGLGASFASLALATLGAGAFSFVGCLAYAMACAGGAGAVVLVGLVAFALMAAAGVAVLAYVLSSAFEVAPSVALAAMALHVAVLAPLMTHPTRPASAVAAAVAAAVCLSSLLRRKRKPTP